jgi:hypothetical protein
MPQHRFPPPWSVEEPDQKLDRWCFIVRDNTLVLLTVVVHDVADRGAAVLDVL